MIVAVTGGTGFIGRKLVLRHLELGDEVRVLSRRRPAELEFADSVNWYCGDLAGAGDLRPFVNNADILYHCAGEIRDESRMQAVHVAGTQNLIDAAAGAVGRWVQLSSVGVYGQPGSGVVTEQSPLLPLGVYETTKKQSDDLVTAAGRKDAFEWTILRPSIVYGEGMPNQSLFEMIRAVDGGYFFYIGCPGASANYIHVDNVVETLSLYCLLPQATGKVFNLSDYATWEFVVGIVAKVLERRKPYARLPERMVRIISKTGMAFTQEFPLTNSRIDALTTRAAYPIDSIRKCLGYHHKVTMETGICRLTQYWMETKRQG
jgi:nucleoside-diphosphate-sugar epimerase